MTDEQSFIRELKAEYEKTGWAVEEPGYGRDELGFEPDILLRRGDEHLVVDVKREGFVSSRAARLIRDLIQTKPGWHFEVKFIPANRPRIAHESDTESLLRRIKLSKMLQLNGDYTEAFILNWTSLEAALRILLGVKDQRETLAPSNLFVKGYEDGLISDEELRQLNRGIQARNRVMHGMSIDHIEEEVSALIPVTEHLVHRLL